MFTQINCRRASCALLCLAGLWSGMARSQSPAPSVFGAEMSKQDAIYRSTGRDVPTGYSINRSLEEYARGLSDEFERSLAALNPTERWLDVGAGTGQAILDYYAASPELQHPEAIKRWGKKANTVALSMEDRRTAAWHQAVAGLESKQLQYVFGKPLRDYTRDEIGRFQLITDVLGGFSYTDNLSRYMEKVLDFLEIGGNFFGVLQDVDTEAGNRPFYPNARFLTEILNADSSSVKICAWLKSISCVKATCELKSDWKPPIEKYHIRKACDAVRVPELLRVHYEAGTPPERRFQLQQVLPTVTKVSDLAR